MSIVPGPRFLEGDRIALRTFEEEDVEFLHSVINTPSVWKSVGGQMIPSTIAQEHRFYEELSRDETAVQFVIAAEASRVGVIELNPISWESGSAEVSYWIDPDAQGHGYATEALSLIAGYAFQNLRLHKLIAEAFDFNESSQRVLENVGFEREGVLREEEFVDGEFIDVYRYGLLAPAWTEFNT